jgi:hypothetical protein
MVSGLINLNQKYTSFKRSFPYDDKNQGDVELREFMGSTGWFENSQRIKELVVSNANRHLKAIIKNEQIEDLVAEEQRFAEFLSPIKK